MRRAVLGLALALLTGCGAFDEDSTPLTVVRDCPSAESKLSSLTELVETGQLQGLQSALSEQIEADVRTRLVSLILALLDRYEPGTFPDLAPVVEGGLAGDLVGGLRLPLERIVGLESWAAMGVLGQLLQQCTGRPLLLTVRDLLADTAVRADLEILLAGPVDTEGALASLGIDLTSLEGRQGFQALVRSVLISLTRSDFDILSLTGPDGLLQLLSSDESPAVDALVRIVERLLGPGPALESVQVLTGCLLDVDSEDQLSGLVFDLLTGPEPLELPETTLYPGGALEAVDRLLVPLLELLVERADVRRSAVIVLSSLLEPSVAAQFLPDVIVLLDAALAQDLLELILLLSRDGGC